MKSFILQLFPFMVYVLKKVKSIILCLLYFRLHSILALCTSDCPNLVYVVSINLKNSELLVYCLFFPFFF